MPLSPQRSALHAFQSIPLDLTNTLFLANVWRGGKEQSEKKSGKRRET
jgi:hypothetical protein